METTQEVESESAPFLHVCTTRAGGTAEVTTAQTSQSSLLFVSYLLLINRINRHQLRKGAGEEGLVEEAV